MHPYNRAFRGALQLETLAHAVQDASEARNTLSSKVATHVNGAHPLVCAVSLYPLVSAQHSGF